VKRGLLGVVLVGLLALFLSGSATANKIGPAGFSVGALKAPNADLNGDKIYDDLASKLDTMDDADTLSVIVRMKGDLTQARVDAVEQTWAAST